MLVPLYQEKMQMRKQSQWTTWELGCPRWTLHAHVSERERFIQNNQDPYKGEIKIPPPYPYKRKNINYFSHSKDPYFLLIMELLGLIIKSFDNQTKMRNREFKKRCMSIGVMKD
jgi:hypothetical protein